MRLELCAGPVAGPYRQERRQLDLCLSAIEEAVACGETILSPELANWINPSVPSVAGGMLLAKAQQRVFEAQRYLFSHRNPIHAQGDISSRQHGGYPGVRRSTVDREDGASLQAASDPPMSRAEAEALTERIKTCVGELPVLLLEAHERRAWVAMGYRSWERYARSEFRLSRSRSYELLDLARTLRALREALGDVSLPGISSLAAMEIKPFLQQVVAEVKEALGDESCPANEIDAVVRRVISRSRVQARAARLAYRRARRSEAATGHAAQSDPVLLLRQGGAPIGSDASPDIAAILHAIAMLAKQPSAGEIVGALSDSQMHQFVQLPAAARWLQQFLNEWSARRARGRMTPAM